MGAAAGGVVAAGATVAGAVALAVAVAVGGVIVAGEEALAVEVAGGVATDVVAVSQFSLTMSVPSTLAASWVPPPQLT